MQVAHSIAMRSTCKRRQVGAVLVDRLGRMLSTGYNGVPRGFIHCTVKPCQEVFPKSGSDLHKCHAVHAEQNALIQCPDTDRIDTLIVTVFPCIHCQKLLLNTPCRTILFQEEYDTEIIWDRHVLQYNPKGLN